MSLRGALRRFGVAFYCVLSIPVFAGCGKPQDASVAPAQGIPGPDQSKGALRRARRQQKQQAVNPKLAKHALGSEHAPLRVHRGDVKASASQLLGEGGNGVVFKALVPGFGLDKQHFAVKIAQKCASTLITEARFMIWASAYGLCPRILGFIEPPAGTSCDAPGCQYPVWVRRPDGSAELRLVYVVGLVMELMDQGTLTSAITNKFKSYGSKVVALLAAARCLQAMHARGVLHGDVKGGNFLVSSRRSRGSTMYDVKVSDFGASRHLDSEGGVHCKSSFGTHYYMAPEVKKLGDGSSKKTHGRVIAASDVYSFSVLLLSELGIDHCQCDAFVYCSLRKLPHGQRWVDLVAMCRAAQPEHRASMAQVVEVLEQLQGAFQAAPNGDFVDFVHAAAGSVGEATLGSLSSQRSQGTEYGSCSSGSSGSDAQSAKRVSSGGTAKGVSAGLPQMSGSEAGTPTSQGTSTAAVMDWQSN